MTERNDAVLQRVKTELERDSTMSVENLKAVAKEIDPKVGKLSLRQFNARYVLPLKRKKSARRKRSEAGTSSKASRIAGDNGKREAMRKVFLEFARDLSQAESRAAIVEVVSGLDRYVDRALSVPKK